MAWFAVLGACHDLDPIDAYSILDPNAHGPAHDQAPATGTDTSATFFLPFLVKNLVTDGRADVFLKLSINGVPTTAQANGLTHLSTQARGDDPLAIRVTQEPRGQTCEVTSQGQTVADAAKNGIVVSCRVTLRLRSGQAAVGVLGQPSTTSCDPAASPTARTLHDPYGNALSPPGSDLIFVTDSFNNRVLAYRTPLADYQEEAILAVGQADLARKDSPPTTAQSLNAPSFVDSDGQRLVVADLFTNRVLVYSDLPGASNVAADLVLGQNGDMTTSTHTCTPQGLNQPRCALLVKGGLAISDSENNRVVIYNKLPSQQSALGDPDVILGPADGASCAATQSFWQATPVFSPRSLHWDGTYFFVADRGGNRVLIWQGLPTINRPPDIILGQPDLATTAPASTRSGLSGPQAVISDSETIWVADADNHRVLAYPRAGLTTGMEAEYVLGQTNFTKQMANGGASDCGPNSFDTPRGLAVIGLQLFVTDQANHRVLFFDSQN